MKRFFYLAIVLSFSMSSFAQYSNFSLALNYPIPMDNFFIGENYNGLIDVGADYTFYNANQVNIALALNTSILQNKVNQNVGQPFKITSYVFQPKVIAKMNPAYLGGFTPSAGIGYSFFVFDVSGSDSGFTDEAGDTQSGFNLNLGVAYDLSERFFAQVQYDFMRTSVSEGVPDIKYNTNVNLLKIGLGYRF